MAGLALVCKLVGKDTGKISATIITMSAAIAILAGVAIILGWIDLASLAKGVIAVGILSAMMSLMIHAAKGVQNCMGSIIAMAVAIGVMAVAVAALSFIDGSKLAGAVAALSVLMGMFALMEKAAPTVKRAEAPVINRTLSALLGLLKLSNKHREHLKNVRCLTDSQIDKIGFKSTPPFYMCEKLARTLIKNGFTVEGVPGFYKRNGVWTVMFC